MHKKILSFLIFAVVILMLFSYFSFLFAQDSQETGQTTEYEFTLADMALLVQPAVCYITSVWYAYVYDPATGSWSNQYSYGPFGGTGFCINPDAGIIITAGHMVDISYVDLKWAILDEYIYNTYPDDYDQLSDSDWNTIYNYYKVEGQNTAEPDKETWVQFNTAIAGIPDDPDDTYTKAEVIKFSPWEQRDIAIIKITPTTGRALSSVIIGDSSLVEIGDKLTMIGYPWTSEIGQDNPLNPTVTTGNISGKVMFEGTEVLQIQGYAVAGNSGSPVLGEDGSVIGMLTMGTDETTNYLRPANDIKMMLEAENKLGQVDEEWGTGLAMFRQNHFSEAIRHFDSVLNLSAGHLLAQEYKAKAQQNMANDVPLVAETTATTETVAAEETAAETFSEETVKADEKAGISNTTLIIIISAGVAVIIIIVIILVVLLRRKSRPQYTGFPEPVTAVHPAGEVSKKTSDAEKKTVTAEKGKAGKKFCPGCGQPVKEGQTFCSNCGNKLT